MVYFKLVNADLKWTDPEKSDAVELCADKDHDDTFHVSGSDIHSRIRIDTPMHKLSSREIFDLAYVMKLIQSDRVTCIYFRGDKFTVHTDLPKTSMLLPDFPGKFEAAYKSITAQLQELSKSMPSLRHIYENGQYIWSHEYLIIAPPRPSWRYHLPYQVWEQSQEVRGHLQAFIAGKLTPANQSRLLEPQLIKNILVFLTIQTVPQNDHQ